MATIFTQDPSVILDTFADAIEGGNSYAGGTSFKGIPGLHSNASHLRNGDDTPITVAGNTSLSTTTFDAPASKSWPKDRWVNDARPPMFAVCTTSGGATSILNERRKITNYNNVTKVFTVGTAFSAAPIANDVMAMQEGFKRLPNDIDIEEVGGEEGYDRTFHLSAEPGDVTGWFGDNSWTMRTEMVLRLRMLKYDRLHDWTSAVMTNLAIIRAALVRREHYESTYTRALLPAGELEVADDVKKVVASARFILVYKVDGTVA